MRSLWFSVFWGPGSSVKCADADAVDNERTQETKEADFPGVFIIKETETGRGMIYLLAVMAKGAYRGRVVSGWGGRLFKAECFSCKFLLSHIFLSKMKSLLSILVLLLKASIIFPFHLSARGNHRFVRFSCIWLETTVESPKEGK